MGRILSIDYGEVRIGMAQTDPLQISINPLPTIATDEFAKTLESFLEIGEITDVVFGYPLHKDGSPTAVTGKVDLAIKKYSEKFGSIRFHKIDESFSSVKAREMMLFLGVKKKNRKVKGNIDKMSAVIILKEFLDKR